MTKVTVLEGDTPDSEKALLIENIKLKTEEDKKESFSTLKPQQWFVKFTDNVPLRFGAIYDDVYTDAVEEAQSIDFHSVYNKFLDDYQLEGQSYLELTYGLTSIYRKFVIRIFIKKTSLSEQITLQIATQYFTNEHQISINDYNKTLNKLYEAIY